MALMELLTTQVVETLTDNWETQETNGVPQYEDLRLNSAHAKLLKDAVVLYADMDGSTNMVDHYKWWFSAGVYKAYLRCAAQIIASEQGSITAYDGDRVMAVFVGENRSARATRAALKINSAVKNIIGPIIKSKWSSISFVLGHSIGIDKSDIYAARVGIRGETDIVWVGSAANHAAKLCNRPTNQIWITEKIYAALSEEVLIALDGSNMWGTYRWEEFDNSLIYGSDFWWTNY